MSRPYRRHQVPGPDVQVFGGSVAAHCVAYHLAAAGAEVHLYPGPSTAADQGDLLLLPGAEAAGSQEPRSPFDEWGAVLRDAELVAGLPRTAGWRPVGLAELGPADSATGPRGGSTGAASVTRPAPGWVSELMTPAPAEVHLNAGVLCPRLLAEAYAAVANSSLVPGSCRVLGEGPSAGERSAPTVVVEQLRLGGDQAVDLSGALHFAVQDSAGPAWYHAPAVHWRDPRWGSVYAAAGDPQLPGTLRVAFTRPVQRPPGYHALDELFAAVTAKLSGLRPLLRQPAETSAPAGPATLPAGAVRELPHRWLALSPLDAPAAGRRLARSLLGLPAC